MARRIRRLVDEASLCVYRFALRAGFAGLFRAVFFVRCFAAGAGALRRLRVGFTGAMSRDSWLPLWPRSSVHPWTLRPPVQTVGGIGLTNHHRMHATSTKHAK